MLPNTAPATLPSQAAWHSRRCSACPSWAAAPKADQSRASSRASRASASLCSAGSTLAGDGASACSDACSGAPTLKEEKRLRGAAAGAVRAGVPAPGVSGSGVLRACRLRTGQRQTGEG